MSEVRRSRSSSISQSLEYYYHLVKRTILDFQHPVTGLLPASLYRARFNVEDADCGDSWIRDNVYSILAVWALSKSFCKSVDSDEEKSKQYELEQSVVKLMRGLLQPMMRQVEKVERFKKTQAKDDSLHAKYGYSTGQTVVGDKDWGHLQIDAISLYLLVLAQMTAGGLQIIYNKDEVDFIQNLVFYIETAYRTPDFGIWERGDKTNRGMTELNASSIGMAKAALEALSELDLYGSRGGLGSIVHVQADQIQYCKAILHSMLPRESHSKECGSALLSVISFPAFAVEDPSLISATKAEILGRLQGRYGCKRFLRDGHKCENEDRHRLHYELHELQKFEHIECEWPVFFCFLFLDGIYNNNKEQASQYKSLLDALLVRSKDDVVLVPELFHVPKDKIELERETPHSQARLCGDRVPHFWSQSLYIVACLLHEGLIAVGELDPLNRRYATAPKPELVVQVALIAEDSSIQKLLAENGIPSQTQDEAAPLRILPARCLSRIYSRLGKNKKLGLSGRPYSDIGTIAISSLYRADGTLLAFTPQFLDYRQFYLCLDNDLLVDSFKTAVEHLRTNWKMLGRPTLTIPITHAILEDSMTSAVGKFLLQASSGYLYSVRIRMGNLLELRSRSCIKKLDFVDHNDLEDLICDFPDPTLSPRPGEVLRHISITEDAEDQKRVEGARKTSVYGVISRSRSISRAASWGSGSDDEVSGESLVRGFILNTMGMAANDRLEFGFEQIDIEEIRTQLEETDSISEQADILYYLYLTRGYNYDVALYGMAGCTVGKLLRDLYDKACHLKLWSLIRHTSGVLEKTVENLGEVCTDLIVNQKQIGVGLPLMNREEVIKQPLPPSELKKLIFRSCGEDSSTAVLTQELLSYMSMFVITDPGLFKEMLQIRVGLIMEVMAAEYARVSGLLGEEAADHLMNLSPFQMKQLLYYILSGKEFGVNSDGFQSVIVGQEKKGSMIRVQKAVKKISMIMQRQSSLLFEDILLDVPTTPGPEALPGPLKIGQWLRRRCLDGALNRVPVGFYGKMWNILDRCHGLSVERYGFWLEHKLTLENTSGEMKFALRVEEELNKMTYPEYRQLVVEALLVLSLLIGHDQDLQVNYVIRLDEIVNEANQMFLKHQTEEKGDATLCCAVEKQGWNQSSKCGASNSICRYFYDSAPSGAYGTMTYFAKAILRRLYGTMADSPEPCRVS